MNAIIVDDDKLSRTSLKTLCGKIEGLSIMDEIDNGLSAMKYLTSHEVDLVFLDVEMPDFSGIDLIKTVKDLPQVILVTGKAEYALEAFELEVTDYLTKPVTLARLQKAVDRVQNINKDFVLNERDFIFVKVDGRLVKLNFDQILFIETLGDYVQFYTDDGKKHIVHSTLKGIDEKLNHPFFVKVHRSYIVNISKIVDIEESNLVISNKVIPISRAQKPLLMKKINTI